MWMGVDEREMWGNKEIRKWMKIWSGKRDMVKDHKETDKSENGGKFEMMYRLAMAIDFEDK